MQATAFIKGLWFDNVIACYILLLPLVILWITALCNYHSKWAFRFISIFSFYLFTVVHYFGSQHPLFLLFFKQSILPFTIGSDMEPLLPEWYWVRHHSISLFSRTDIYSSAVRKCTTVIFLFLSSHQFEIYFHQPDKPPMYIRHRCCLYRTLSIRNTGTHGI